jgi:hypothetical protein
MKLYYNFGQEEFNMETFRNHILENQLTIEHGIITSAKILERKFLSNKGNAVDGDVKFKDYSIGLNIGQNPIGTGYKNYIPFLEEMECKKIGPLFRIESIIGKDIFALTNKYGASGYFTPKGFNSL